jgi:hypothetical protein
MADDGDNLAGRPIKVNGAVLALRRRCAERRICSDDARTVLNM